MSLSSGTKLGPYEILSPLGAGGMGEVYRARDLRLDREVAVKVLTEHLAGDAHALARFEREAKAVAALSHPNILAIFDYGTEGGVAYAGMELLEGQTLKERLAGGSLPASRATDIASQIAKGLAAAHAKGIVHRDLKPGNVFITDEGHVKILDFGLAKLSGREPAPNGPLEDLPTAEAHTSAGAIMGTMGYMAPEQARGRPADARSDLFAFGVILYEMLSGRRAFDGESASDILVALLSKDPEPLPPVTPASLDRVVRRCLEKRPEDRFQSAHDLALALEVASSHSQPPSAAAVATPVVPTSSPPMEAPLVTPSSGWLARHWVKLLAGVVVVALAALLGGWAVWFKNGKAAPKGPALSPKRVVVAAFENQTGDRSLDALGRMATDSLTQGLSKIPGIEVAPTGAGAGRVVSATYYLQGQTLRFQVKVTDATTGNIIYAPEPFAGSREEPQKIIDDLDQHVMGAIAAAADGSFDPRFVTPPTYEAYREYVAAEQMNAVDWTQAIGHYERAAEIDPAFAWALIAAAGQLGNFAEFEKEDPILSRLNQHRERLTPFERDYLDASRAGSAGQWTLALLAYQHAVKIDPANSNTQYMVGFAAAFANMPRLVLDTIPDPTRLYENLPYRTTIQASSFTVIADACHLLGDHQRELEVADKGILSFPDVLEVRFGKVRAYAASGRVEDVRKAVDATLGSSFVEGTPDDLMLLASLELRAHGKQDAAVRMASQSVGWLRGQPPAVQAAPNFRPALARALYAAERWDESLALYQQLAKEHPLVEANRPNRGDPNAPKLPEALRLYNAIDYLGALGALAARRGDRAEALRISDELAGINCKYLFGNHTYRRACIAAQLGEKDRAVRLLSEAAAQGYLWRLPIILQIGALAFHASQDLEPLHGYPPYEELMKPKG